MDRCAIIRSVVGATGGHDAVQCLTGWKPKDLAAMGGRPSLGAAVARLQGAADPSVPPFVGLCGPTGHRPWSDPGSAGFLGTAFGPFKPEGEGLSDLKLNGVTLDQLTDRKRLRTSFDGLRRQVEVSDALKGMDALTERALGVLTSSKLLEALDLSREPEKIRSRYGDGKPYNYQFDGARRSMTSYCWQGAWCRPECAASR